MEKFDLNEKTETTASDSTTPPFEIAPWELQIIRNIWRRAYLDSEEDHVKILKEYGEKIASLQKQQEREKTITNPNDVAYTMHQLIMLVNYLEELGIKAKWEGEFWVVEQSGILLKFLDWFDGDLKVLKNHESLIHEYFTEKLTP